ncbi:MAG: hypothetical protein K8S20_03895 [Chloroflexi bacterium]|nr:hypothetical protein [Chloroflexota bacterium]
MNKVLFVERLQRERDKFEHLLNRVGFTRQMTMKGVFGSHSVKDLLADILTREQFIADRMNEIQHGETYAPSMSHTALENFHRKHGYPDYESTLLEKEIQNHLVIHKHRNIGVDDIVEQELAAYENILHMFEKFSLGQCLDNDLFHRIAEHTYKPWRRMSIEINRWLSSIASESK